MLRTVGRIFIAMVIKAIAFGAVYPIARDMIAHNMELSEKVSEMDRLSLTEVGTVEFFHNDVGLLFGNGNHTDFWILRIIRVQGDIKSAITKLRKAQDSSELHDIVFETPGVAMAHVNANRFRDLGIYDKYAAATDIIVVEHIDRTSAGWDPRSN